MPTTEAFPANITLARSFAVRLVPDLHWPLSTGLQPDAPEDVWRENHNSARLRVLAVRVKNFRKDDVGKADRELGRSRFPATHPRRTMTEAVDSCKAEETIRRQAGCFLESP